MADPHIFEITDGYLGLSLVDTGAVGYLATWQSPTGDVGTGVAAAPLTADLTDYEASSTDWTCQVTQAQILTRPSTRTVTRRPTFCAPGATIPTPDESQYQLQLRWYQDLDVVDGLSLWLFENDTEEAFFYLGFNLDAPPTAVGRVRVAAGQIGGDPRIPLEATLTMSLSGKPLIEPVTA